jgi:FMN phosphatase YigB (HAD superfamily)
MSTGVQLVIFDLGRVLVRLCDGLEHACEVAGVEMPAGLPPLTEAEKQRIEELAALVDTGAIDIAAYARQVAPLRRLQADDVLKMQHVFLRGPFPGAFELLDELHAGGINTACLSNTHNHHWRQMLDGGDPNFLPLERMTYRFASHLLGMRKPLDAIYEHVERTTGAAPGSILFFDDLEANVAAAHRRGWHAYRVTPCDDPIPQLRGELARHGVLVEAAQRSR